MSLTSQKKEVLTMLILPCIAIAIVSLLYILIPVTHIISEAYQLSSTQTIWLTTVNGLAYASGLLLWGILSDRYGHKKIMLVGLTLLLLCTLGVAYASSFTTLMLFRALQGLFAASFPPAILAWIADNTNVKNLVKNISFMGAAFFLSGVIGQWLGSYFIVNSLNAVMLLLAALYLLAIGFINTLPEKQKAGSQPQFKIKQIFSNMFHLVTHKKLYPYYLSALLVLNAFIAFYLLIGTVQFYAGSAPIASTATLRLVAFPAMFTGLLLPFLAKKIHLERITFLCISCIALTLALQYFSIKLQLNWLLIVAHFVFVASIALSIPALINTIGINIGQVNIKGQPSSNLKGTGLSIYTFLIFIGASLGSYLSTQLSLDALFMLLLTASVLLVLLLFINLKPFSNSQTNKE